MFSFFKKKDDRKESSGFFVPDGNKFIEATGLENLSINKIAEKLGYHTDMTYHHLVGYEQTDEIQSIIFEVFTTNIIFIITSKKVLSLPPYKVQGILIQLSWHDLYDSHTIKSTLEDAIEHESLTIDFMQKVLNLNDNDPNCVLFSEKLGYYLYFSEGVLVDFQTSDGLNEWAKEWNLINPNLVASYEKEAVYYWGEGKPHKILKEINAQADAYANVPCMAWQNPLNEMHTSEFGNINFVNQLVAHYGKEISLKEFKEINHGRYEVISSVEEEVSLKIGRFVYEFSDGEIINVDDAI